MNIPVIFLTACDTEENIVEVLNMGASDYITKPFRPLELIARINKILHKTENNTGLVLNIAFNYGGRDEIVKAVRKISSEVKENKLNIDDIDEATFSKFLYTAGQPDPDLLIRTSGEQRLSNYLLWQLAYTEFYFIKKYWPDFSKQDLDEAISKFEARNRNFGGK